jgi:hypothetical protein
MFYFNDFIDFVEGRREAEYEQAAHKNPLPRASVSNEKCSHLYFF